MKRQPTLRLDKNGQAVIEFAISLPFLVLLTVGSFAVGITLDRYLTLSQVVRNGGNMYARGIDFASLQNKQLIVDAGVGLGLEVTGGKSAVWLTRLTRVPNDAQCGSSGSPRDCYNNGRIVITQRYGIGDVSGVGMGSRLQNVQNATQFVDKTGSAASEGDHVNYHDLSEAIADAAPASLNDSGFGLSEDELIYVVEIIHRPTTISFQGLFAPDYMYARAFF